MSAFGVACTVTWTELVEAFRSDGYKVSDKCGPAVRKWIEGVVRDAFAASQRGGNAAYRPDAAHTMLSAAALLEGTGDAVNAREAAALRSHADRMMSMPAQHETPTFQQRVHPWMLECFGAAIANDVTERCDRFIEEALEKVQAHGYDLSRVAALVQYTAARPTGDPTQEAGGVMVTLAALCLATGVDMHQAGETELARILCPEVIEKIRAKQAAKARDIPFSSLPQRIAPPPQQAEQKDREHIVELSPKDTARLREWVSDPNGACSFYRCTLEAVEHGGILIRTASFRG